MMSAQPAPVSPAANRKSYRLAANINVEVDVPNIAVPVPATLADISEGGCQIVSRVMLLKGVTMQFKLPLEGKPPLLLTGTIRSANSRAETRTFIYGVQFGKLRPADQDAIYQFVVERQRKDLHAKTSAAANTAAAQSSKGRSAYRAQRMFPVTFVVTGLPVRGTAMALDLSRGGTRVAFNDQLEESRGLELRFTLPSEVLKVLTHHEVSRAESLFSRDNRVKEIKPKDFAELRIHAKILPGAERVKNKFVYRLVFQSPTQAFQEEIDRYVHAAQLTELKNTRNV